MASALIGEKRHKPKSQILYKTKGAMEYKRKIRFPQLFRKSDFL